jgi:hypothetical protein
MQNRFTENQIKRFWSHVDVGRDDECWDWKLGTDHGYGKLGVNKKIMRAHRVAYEITNGSLSDNILILHSCDRPICCNPKHLSAGTHLDNARDRLSKGRSGKAHSKIIKLSPEIAINLRADFFAGMSKHALARKYSITPRHVRSVVSGEHWNTSSPAPLVGVPKNP